MTNNDIRDILERVEHEITMLRNQIAVLQPKAEAYGAICTILGLIPQPSQGYGEDILWVIRSERNKIDEAIKEELRARAKPPSKRAQFDEVPDHPAVAPSPSCNPINLLDVE